MSHIEIRHHTQSKSYSRSTEHHPIGGIIAVRHLKPDVGLTFVYAVSYNRGWVN